MPLFLLSVFIDLLKLNLCCAINIGINPPSISPYDIFMRQLVTDASISNVLNNVVFQNTSARIIMDYKKGIEEEDVNLNIEELITKYGYPFERHETQTDDGYLLTMFRIPGRSQNAVLLMHGLLSSADDWVTLGPSDGIAYTLAREGYDVWLGNARGNKHSRKHVSLSPESEEFWDFSWDEIGRYDLAAMIDYILTLTNQAQLRYVGHSQGTTTFFVLCSERPEYNNKISVMVALSAVAWMPHVKSPIIRLMSPYNPLLHFILKVFGFHEFLPSKPVINMFKLIMCGNEILADLICSNIVFLLCGFDYDEINFTRLPVLFAHVPSGAATKQLVHYAQEIVSGRFQRFDYGSSKNMKLYGTKLPPQYDVGRITAPIAIMYSEGDWLAHVNDVETLNKSLKNVVDFYKIPMEKFNHLDFIWAKDINYLVIPKLIKLLQSTNLSMGMNI